MSFFRKPYNLIYNLYKLLTSAFRYEKLHWHILAGNKENCKIDKDAKLHGSYRLSNVTVGKGTYISFNANISNTTIGKFCSIGPNFFCGWGIHPLNGISTSPAFYSLKKQSRINYTNIQKVEERKAIEIGNDVFIGANVTVLDGVKISDGAVIGAGAVVSKNIPPYAIAIGCPIEIVKYRFTNEVINSLLLSKWWDMDDEKLKSVERNFFEVEKFLEDFKNNPPSK